MNWLQAVDIYCERGSAGFWAEPVNALSNLSFIAAAIWAAVTAQARGIKAPIVWLLITMGGLIGIGSFLFHTFANRWSELADVLPIWSFVAVYVLTAMHVIGGMPLRRVGIWAFAILGGAGTVVLFSAMGEGAPTGATAPDPLNGSGQYAPALVALMVFAVLSARRGHPGARWIAGATGVFLLSLIFRTIDRDICASLSLGTHFLWHLLNGLMVGLLLQMLIRTGNFKAYGG